MVKELACECKRLERHRFNPWFRKIPWRRAWQPTSLFLPEESHGFLPRGPWWATVYGAAKNQTQLKRHAQLINNVIVLGGQRRDSAIHIHVSFLPQTPLSPGLPYDIEQSSLCSTIGPCWLKLVFSPMIMEEVRLLI